MLRKKQEPNLYFMTYQFQFFGPIFRIGLGFESDESMRSWWKGV